jgi:hypothetical protein
MNRFDQNGYALDDIKDVTPQGTTVAPSGVRQVQLKGTAPAVLVTVDDRTFDATIHEELAAQPVE